MKIRSLMTKIVIATSMFGVAHAEPHASNDALSNTWTGFYAGLNAGAVLNDVQLNAQQLGFTNSSETCNTSSDFSTFSPGIQLGYLYQFSNAFVSGVETNINFNTRQNKTLNCNCPYNPNVSDRFPFKNQMQGSIKARGGRALNWHKGILLPYVTTGASFANLGLSYENEGNDYYSQNNTQAGWLIGAGIEWSFWQHWSLRVEYAYVDYRNNNTLNIPSVYGLIDPNGNAYANLNTNSILVAINYWM